MDEESVREAVRHAKIPILVLDQKWHRLFAISGKPQEVKDLEVALNEELALQGRLNNELKELKKLKSRLMKDVVENIDHAGDEAMGESHRLIEETNEKIAADEDELLDIPDRIKQTDAALMMETMKFCYGKLRTNAGEINEIADWIKNVRIELKKNIIRKQNREINNKEIYSYMHDIFGKDVMTLFDVADEQNLLSDIKPREEGTAKVKVDPAEAAAQRPPENFSADEKKEDEKK